MLVRDLDDLAAGKLGDWLHKSLPPARAQWNIKGPEPTASERVWRCQIEAPNGPTTAVIVGVGLPENATLTGEYGIERFALDDYLLLLIRDLAVYTGISEMKDNVDHPIVSPVSPGVAHVLELHPFPHATCPLLPFGIGT